MKILRLFLWRKRPWRQRDKLISVCLNHITSMSAMSSFSMRLYLLLFTSFLLVACEGEINTNENAAGFAPQPEQGSLTLNDDFFHAYDLFNLPRTISDSLSATDTVDYFIMPLALYQYRSYNFSLISLTGDADLEIFNAYLNKESWSENSGTEDELIRYWRNYTDLDNNFVYIKVINQSGGDVSYTLEVN